MRRKVSQELFTQFGMLPNHRYPVSPVYSVLYHDTLSAGSIRWGEVTSPSVPTNVGLTHPPKTFMLRASMRAVAEGGVKLFEQVLRTQVVYAGAYLSTERRTVVLPDGRQAIRDIVRPPDAVAIVPIDDDGRIYLVRQYRPAIRRAIYEIPAGIIDPGERRRQPPGGSARRRSGFARAGCSSCAPSIPRLGSPQGLSDCFSLKDL